LREAILAEEQKQMNEVPLFISLDPDATLAALVRRYKRRVRQLVGKQTFLDHPPHITTFLAHFPDSAERAIVDVVASLAEALGPEEVRVVGWHVFAEDALTGSHTLVLRFDDDTRARLQKLQGRTIGLLSDLRDRPATKQRYAARWTALSADQQRAVDELGFPYCGADWHPHLTIASIGPVEWPRVAREVLNDLPQAAGCINALTVYRLVENEPVPIRTFSLRSCEVTA
jgi:2'-5' RNA ligase